MCKAAVVYCMVQEGAACKRGQDVTDMQWPFGSFLIHSIRFSSHCFVTGAPVSAASWSKSVHLHLCCSPGAEQELLSELAPMAECKHRKMKSFLGCLALLALLAGSSCAAPKTLPNAKGYQSVLEFLASRKHFTIISTMLAR